MRATQQLIVAAAVVFATLAVGFNVYASTRGAEQRAQELAREIPVASVLDRGVFDDSSADESSDDVVGDDAGDNPATRPMNHGFIVSSFARHIGYAEGIDGPPGLLVREIARPTGDRETSTEASTRTTSSHQASTRTTSSHQASTRTTSSHQASTRTIDRSS